MCSINHDLKAVYLHIPKTGGSYISSILSTYYGFKNYYLKRPDHIQFTRSNDNSIDKHENKTVGTYLYYSSCPYLNKIMNMNAEKWKTYKIFSFVRHPLKRLQSGFQYVKQKGYYQHIDFDTFCQNAHLINCWSYWHTFMTQNTHLINEKNENVCFMIGKQENMEKDLTVILEHFGLNIKHRPFIKNKTLTQSPQLLKYNKHLIYILLKDDFKNFEYQCM